MTEKKDWRQKGQEKYLMGKAFTHKKYTPYKPNWEHDHCEFCSVKISEKPEDENVAYCTNDEYHWVCEKCFEDFKTEFKWTDTNQN